ncbi:MAG TPA: hypothetical protein VGB13_05115, partial [Candidatus Krumholzibacteria bacterium]
MAKVTLWPDIYKEQGHWLPCVSLARSLQNEGYSVEFMGIPDTSVIVQPYGVRAVGGAGTGPEFHTVLEDIYPFGHSFENKLEPLDQRWKPHHVLPIARGALDAVFASATPPDLLISGYFTALETLIIHRKHGIPFVIMTTFLRHPQDDPASRARTQLVYMSDPLRRKLFDLVTGNPDMSIAEFIAPLTEFPELIPCPKEFDLKDDDWTHGPLTHYVEPMVVRGSLDGGATTPADPVPELPENVKLIYATSGSQVQDYEFRARQFFINLIDMMKTQGGDQYHLIIAAGDKLNSQLRREYNVGGASNATAPS